MAQNLPQKEGNNVADISDSLTSKMDILQNVGKFGLSESQRATLSLQMLTESNANREVKDYSSKMAAELLAGPVGRSNSSSMQRRSKMTSR